jgi:hypothetical protein
VVAKVPATRGRTPKLAGSKSGVHFVPKRNSLRPTSRKKATVSSSSEKTIPAVVRSEIDAASKSRPLIALSP